MSIFDKIKKALAPAPYMAAEPKTEDELRDLAFEESADNFTTDEDLAHALANKQFFVSTVTPEPRESFSSVSPEGARFAASVRADWLLDACALTGYPVIAESNWMTAGHGNFTSLEGVIGHHTAGRATLEYPSRRVVRDGRSDLPGPLANLGLGRSGTIYVVAAGVAWHAGVSDWAGFVNLNKTFLGIEAEDDGTGSWTKEQLDCYPRLVAALLHYMKKDGSRYASHRSVANPFGRKPDPAKISDEWMRAKVDPLLLAPVTISRNYRAPASGPIVVDPVVVNPVPYPQHDKRILPLGPPVKLGDTGKAVIAVQQRLAARGWTITVDGDFGPATEKIVIAFQKEKGLTPDGIVGPLTWYKMWTAAT